MLRRGKQTRSGLELTAQLDSPSLHVQGDVESFSRSSALPAPVNAKEMTMYWSEEKNKADLIARFKIVCRKCESENVVIDIKDGVDYGGMTGYSPGHITIGCNDCKQNDFYMPI